MWIVIILLKEVHLYWDTLQFTFRTYHKRDIYMVL